MDNLKWQKRRKLNIVDLVEKIEDLSKQVVKNQMDDIGNKLGTLEAMGAVSDPEKLRVIREKIKEIGL